MTKSKPFEEVLRAARGKLTQAQAAAKLGIPIGSYLNWEQGRRQPDALKREAILRGLA